MDSEEVRKAEEAAQRFKAQLKKIFPTIGTVYSVHDGPNRADHRRVKFKHTGTSTGKKPTNTQKPAFF